MWVDLNICFMAFFERLVNLIAPHECLLCQAEGELLCEACASKAVIIKRAACYRCNTLTSFGQTCESCRSSSDLSGVTVAAYYDGVVKDLIHELKYEQARAAATVLARLMIPSLDPDQFDLISAVPVDPERRRERGYNQAELIGRAMASELDIPYIDTLLRVKPIHQIGAQRVQRLTQVKGAFLPYRELFIKDARILLVDDVITTGATLSECASVLKQAGAKRVWAAAAAKH